MSTADRVHRVACIGAGRIAQVHLRFARQNPRARIVAVCDTDRARAEQLASAHQVPAVFTDVDEMMRTAEPSIVHVVTPPSTHARLAIAAMEGGANVLVEKPMAMTVEECDRMIETARRHGRRICVDHNRLFDPVILRARAFVDSGRLGDIVSVEAHQGVNPVELGGASNGQKHWSVENAFAPLYNLAPHPLYLVRAFCGPVVRSEILGRHLTGDQAIVGEVRMLVEGERAFGYVAFSMGTQPYLNHVNVFGTKATLRINLNTMTVLVERVRKLPKLVAKTLVNLEQAQQLVTATISTTLKVAMRRMKLYPGIGETIRRFYRSLDEGAPPPVDEIAGREVVEMLEDIIHRLGPEPALAARANGAAIDPGARNWTS
jgi:predicted dehydrogenase